MRRHQDLYLGLVDAVVLATAESLKIDAIPDGRLRHFRAVEAKLGPLRLLPADL